MPGRACHVIISAIEHPAVLGMLPRPRSGYGVETTLLPVDGEGIVDPARFAAGFAAGDAAWFRSWRPTTSSGTIQPVAELARIAHGHGALFHTDAVQAVGKIPLNVRSQPIDLLSLSGAQVARAQGRGGAVRPRRRRLDAAHGRRRAGRRTPPRHGERRGHRRLGPRGGNRPDGNGRRRPPGWCGSATG